MVGVGSLIDGSQNAVWPLALEDEFRRIMKNAAKERTMCYIPLSLSDIFGLQDILENEDVKLDNMFVTSLVTDIIKVRFHSRFDITTSPS